MAYSYQDHTTASSTTGPFSFAAIDGYLSIDHIKVYVDDVLQSTGDYTVNEVTKEVTFGTALGSGAFVRIRRETPITVSGREVSFTSGAIVRPDDLNNAHLQALFISQETEDFSIKDPPADQKAEGRVLTWDSHTSSWVAAVSASGPGGGLSDGTYGDIDVSNQGSVLTVRSSVITSTKMGGDVTTVGKDLITASTTSAQKSALGLVTVASTGSYSDLSGTPSLSTVATSGSYSDLTGTPSLSTVATSGSYSDLTGTPSLSTVATSGSYSDLSGTPSLSTVATSGSYNDLAVKAPVATVSTAGLMSTTDKSKLDGIAAGAEVNVNADWNAVSGDSQILNKPTIPVDLDDLSNVSSTTPSTGDVLKYNGTSGLWEPGTDQTSGQGPGGAPTDAQYLTLAADGDLSDERVLTFNATAFTTTDGGAGGTYTVAPTFGTTAGTIAQGNHTHTLSAISDAGTAASKNVPASGDASTTEVVLGTDTRLTDARTPTTHNHTLSQVTDAGTSASLNVAATGNAAVGEVVKGDDTRLTDARTPTTHNHTLSEVTDAGTSASLNVAATGNASVGEVVKGDDTRLTDSRTPTAHAASHASGGSDALSLDATQITSGKLAIGLLPTGTSSTQVALGDHTHTITGNYSGHIETAANKTYYLDLRVPYARTIDRLEIIAGSGSCSADLTDQTGSILPSGAVSVSSSLSSTTGINNPLSAGDELRLVITSNNSALDVRWSVAYTQSI